MAFVGDGSFVFGGGAEVWAGLKFGEKSSNKRHR